MDTRCSAATNGETGHRGDTYTRDTSADQCGTTAAAATGQQLGYARGRPPAGLWRLVLTRGLRWVLFVLRVAHPSSVTHHAYV
jgi:hypothetical protein